MAGRSGGHYRLGGRWWQYGDEPNILLDPLPPTPMRNLPDPLASKYPTLAKLSELLRAGYYGKRLTHSQLVDVLEASVRKRPWQSASDAVFESWRDWRNARP
jgi:hypothetical protein